LIDCDFGKMSNDTTLSIIVLGASGDLAQKKTFPALFSLFGLDLLPNDFTIIGYGRSELDDKKLREHSSTKMEGFDDKRDAFFEKVHYFQGKYESEESFSKLSKLLEEKYEKGKTGNRIFYMAVPPTVYSDAAKAIHKGALSKNGFNRLILEKPFGEDLESSNKLNSELTKLFDEDSLYRIDHYLGKEMVQNLITMRFGNVFFEPLWNRNYVDSIIINFAEDIGTEGRAGYFNQYGMIRDVLQNHLLQILALVTMEPPISMQGEDISNEKAKVLKASLPIQVEDTVIGQFSGYLDEEGVPKDSKTATFIAAVLHVNTVRWFGVPFVFRCGKGLKDKKTEIIVKFKKLGCSMFECNMLPYNEILIRISPNEGIFMRMNAKEPGMEKNIVPTELDLLYKSQFHKRLPEAYETLIHDAIKGDKSLFVRGDELQAAWKIVTPLLKKLEQSGEKPETYTFGSDGPSIYELLKKYKVPWNYTSPSSQLGEQ